MMSRFNEIEVYDAEIPEHVRLHLLARKTDMMIEFLGHLNREQARGVDLGCGTGWHVQRLRDKGFMAFGIDNSTVQLHQAQTKRVSHRPGENDCWCLGDIQHLPYATESMDFAFAINAIHHLESRQAQRETVQEIHRILKPDGLFFLHEINTNNLVMSTYMNYIFPRLRRIDNGYENWILPDSLRDWSGFKVVQVVTFTFVPDFTPRILFPLLRRIEGWLERGPLGRYAAHYMAVLQKEGPTSADTN